MKSARRAYGGARSSGNLGKGRVLKSGKTIAVPPRLKLGQVRCHACRNATTLTTEGNYRAHADLFGGPCDAKRKGQFVLDELPPVMHRGEPVTPGLDVDHRQGDNPSRQSGGQGVREWGDCRDCGATVTGERWYCGLCAARRMAPKSRRKES